MRAYPLNRAQFRAFVAAMAVVTGAATAPAQQRAGGSDVVLAPHRAVYDMSLDQARTGSSVTGVKGRMVYELTGSACEGYTQNMRFVTEMTSQDGEGMLTDLRSSTWEDGVAGIFRFNSTTLRNQKATDTTQGDATRAGSGGDIKIELSKPAKKSLALKSGTYFPVQHSIALVKAAKTGQTLLRGDLYDGSEKGEKAYDTTARIGRAVKGTETRLPQLSGTKPLDVLTAWPVTISYYEPGSEKQDATPVYELGFLYFENGVSLRLLIDYGDFAIKGELSDITFLEAAKCEGK